MDKLSVLTTLDVGAMATKTWKADGTVSDFEAGMWFKHEYAAVANIEDVFNLLRKLQTAPKSFIVRGKFNGKNAARTWRRSKDNTFTDHPLHVFCIDVDKFVPLTSDPVSDTEGAIAEYLDRTFSDGSFNDAGYVWQLSSSAGRAKNAGVLKVHLWFWSSEAYTSVQMKSWAAAYGEAVDDRLFQPVQAHYTATPIFEKGVIDPVPCRIGFKTGKNVAVVVPDATGAPEEAEISDLDEAIANQPKDLSEDEIDAYLAAYSPVGLSDEDWYKVGAALNHQYQGGATGLAKWAEWSQQEPDRYDAEVTAVRYKSFSKTDRPVTMASVIHAVKASGGLPEKQSAFDTLLREAAEVQSFEQYTPLKKRIAAMPDAVLPPVARSMVVSALHDNFGVGNSVTKSAITKELQPSKKKRVVDSKTPAWLAPWVYVENTCSFAHSEVPDYSIKREAFNAKFDRMPECVGAETQAAHLALVQHKIETVVDTLFFPKADKFFNHEGKWMMNSFTLKGVAPCDTLDAEGVKAVEMFKAHLAFTLRDKSEQELFVNWMAYIYQNPGKRVGWAMLLQGAQGTGKSYFGNVLEELMGSNVKSLDTGAISGRFTGWATGALVVVVEEIRIAGTNKYQILDKLKPIISNNTIQIEEKGRDHRTVPNFTSYLLLTNHKDAVPLQDGDRRYCALFSRVQSEEQLFAELGGRDAARSYFDSLFDSLRARPDALARFFADHAVPDTFDPCGRAPETTARLEMKALSVSPDRDVVENAIEKHRCEVLSDEIIDLTWLNKMAHADGEMMPKAWVISTVLSDMGFSPIEKRRVKVTGNGYHYIWAKGGLPLEEVKNKVRNFHLSIEVPDL